MITRYVLVSDNPLPWNDLKSCIKNWRVTDKDTGKENFIRIIEDFDSYIVAILRYYVRDKNIEIILNENDEEERKEEEIITQNWATLYFLKPFSPQYVLIRFQPGTSGRTYFRNKISTLISRCISGKDNAFRYARFNIEAIHSDHVDDTWAGAIIDREDNVRSGVFYGNNIAGDSDFGDGYMRSPKNFIGILSSYFGFSEAVRYNKHSFQLYKDHDDNEIISFFRDECSHYII